MRVPGKRFQLPSPSAKVIIGLQAVLKDAFNSLKTKFKNLRDFEDVIINGRTYQSYQIVEEQTPEELVRQTVVEPILNYLGFSFVRTTRVNTPGGFRFPDYTINSRQEGISLLLEVEPINGDMFSRDKGVDQVQQWLVSRFAKTDIGIATDGLRWILVRIDEESGRLSTLKDINIKPMFAALLSQTLLSAEDVNEVLEEFLVFKADRLGAFLRGYIIDQDEKKDEISLRFYKDYIRFVFGLTEGGEKTGEISLLDSVIPPKGVTALQTELFSVITMNRLLFITFLEEQKIVPARLIDSLYKDHQQSHQIRTFYSSYLKPLFFDVFNKDRENRNANIRDSEPYKNIPYLNGSLFRQAIEREEEYDIQDDAMELVIKNLLLKYSFGTGEKAELRPEILGYIFEKTINYISKPGTNVQKAQGAYYTPEDVVSFILKETLEKKIFEKMLEGLRNSGWGQKDFEGYKSIEDILGNLPPNRIHCHKMLEAIETIKVLDPACGSGHFLTNAAATIARVEFSILAQLNENPDLFEIKKKIISNNIFGVDIDEMAVEITKLRLWLSVVSEVRDISHIKTLPNIEFNILAGNSLIGGLRESLVLPVDISNGTFLDPATREMLKEIPSADRDKIISLLQSNKLQDISTAYHLLLSIYRAESGQKVAFLHDLLEKIKPGIYKAYNGAFQSYIADKARTNRKRRKSQGPLPTLRKAFHWSFDFGPVLDSGGFDVVIGNPPYIEDGDYPKSDLAIIRSVSVTRGNNKKVKGKLIPLIYSSYDCGNTHSYFIERSLNLLNSSGRFGFIVPISLVSTDRMAQIREVIHDNSSEVYYYNFDDRPGKIFSGIEHCRSTIVITRKGKGITKVNTSKYNRWYTEERPSLFNDLQAVKLNLSDKRQIVPKIGSKIELEIFKKLNRQSGSKQLGQFLGKGEKVWYHNAPQYWIHAHTENSVPKVEYYSDYRVNDKTKETILGKVSKEETTSQYKFEKIDNPLSPILISLLNSTIFYWWFVIWSDGRHLLSDHIRSFPFDPTKVDKETGRRLTKLVNELMNDYELNANIKVNVRKGGEYAIKIYEIMPKKSYDIIKVIDENIARVFNLSKEESEFIKNFDIQFRMGINDREQTRLPED